MTPAEQKVMVLNLREKTGESMIDCKFALMRNDWCEIKAVDYLTQRGRLVIRTYTKTGENDGIPSIETP